MTQPSSTGPVGDTYVRVRAPTTPVSPMGRVTRALRSFEEFEAAAEGFVASFMAIDQKLAGRLKLLNFIMTIAKRPQDQWKSSMAGLRQDHATLTLEVLFQTIQDPSLLGRIEIALVRYDDAAQAVCAVIETLEQARALAETDPIALRLCLEEHNLAKLKSKIYLLSTLDAHFRSDAVLGQLFPRLNRTAGLNTASLKPPPPQIQTPAPLPAPEPEKTMATRIAEGFGLLKAMLHPDIAAMATRPSDRPRLQADRSEGPEPKPG